MHSQCFLPTCFEEAGEGIIMPTTIHSTSALDLSLLKVIMMLKMFGFAHYQDYFSFNLGLCHLCVLFQRSLFFITLIETI